MQPRTLAIGDIHGHDQALAGLIAAIEPRVTDTLVFLGDYVDSGPDSRGVLERLIGLNERCRVVALKGNHEEMMLHAREGRSDLRYWMTFGGGETLESYGPGSDLGRVPAEHFLFLSRLPLYHETATHFFIHANYDPFVPLDRQSPEIGLWKSVAEIPPPHTSGKIAVVGHTLQKGGRILDLPHLKCIDTGCGHGGLLTALDVTSGRLWQIDESGNLLR